MPQYAAYEPPLVVSISAPTAEGFASLAAELTLPGVAAIEANISCPNIEEDGKAFAMRAESTEKVTRELRAATRLPLWVKLTPNTGDIAEVARAAEAAGADAVVVANTILSMAIDLKTFKPCLGNIMGGLSGPAIKPIVLRQVFQCARAVKIPVIGCGGISTAEDAIEYMLAGASAVQVGTATFLQPAAMITIIDGIERFCVQREITADRDLIAGVVIEEADDQDSRLAQSADMTDSSPRQPASVAGDASDRALSEALFDALRAKTSDGIGITRASTATVNPPPSTSSKPKRVSSV